MNVMVIGNGGREHALGASLARDPHVDTLYFAPGNAGTEEVGENIPIAPTEAAVLARFAVQNEIGLTVVGPDSALAAGVVDVFQEEGLPIFGPTKAAAKVERSKEYAKALMVKLGIPTAAYQAFSDPRAALRYARELDRPAYVKVDGLAGGQGALRAATAAEAQAIITDLMVGEKLGEAGLKVVIEEDLGGPEVPEISLHALCDGNTYKMLPAAQDHKTIYANHEGPMTGGMGTVAPLPGISQAFVDRCGELVVAPILDELRRRGTPFKGLLYPGIKLRANGVAVLEFNARWGDPETQVHMRLLKSSLLEALMACHEGTLDQVDLRWSNMAAACIVLASEGYPGTPTKNVPISGIAEAEMVPGVKVFHAGTKKLQNGKLVTNGGRVLNVTAKAADLQTALDRAYEGVRRISLPNGQYRTDIGAQAVQGLLH